MPLFIGDEINPFNLKKSYMCPVSTRTWSVNMKEKQTNKADNIEERKETLWRFTRGELYTFYAFLL